MSLARSTAVALTIAVLVAIPATATSQHASPGFSYRLRITGRTTEPNGRTTDYVVLSGRALVTAKAGRLDVDDASPKRGAVSARDSYILYDSASMTIVAPRDRQMVRLSRENLERDLTGASVPGTFVKISDVAVAFDSLGSGEPMLGLRTTRYRLTQDYTVATLGPLMKKRNSTEHIVQEFWIADAQEGLANPFARLSFFRTGIGSGFSEIVTKTAEARGRMGRGAPLKTITTNTSTSNGNEVTRTVTTMEVSDLQKENVDDDILVAPTDYQLVTVSALANTAPNAPGARTGQPARASRPAATGDAAAQAKGDFVKTLHGMGRRP
ncbi:MAG TPA: hypothetical protein VF488_00295 [Gemmatimonadaceae bacterium]